VDQHDFPLLDVFLIHWRAPEWCAQAASTVLASTGVRVRCHVVDNGATGGTALAQMLDPSVEVITTDENLGYTGAANVALTRALAARPRADCIVVASHDLVVEPGTLRTLSEALRADARIGIVGPVLTAPALSAGGSWRGWRARGTSAFDPAQQFEEREWMSGTLLMIRPACVEQVGGFDEALGSYVEDVDLCLRARDAGWKVGVAPAAKASGIGSASSNVTLLVDVNSVLLAVKRRGLTASIPIVGRYLYWIGRGTLTSMLPWRTSERRRASFAHARDHARALAQLTRDWRRVRSIARHPSDGVPRFDEA
jgi:GT2 family glycosyltransferase